MEKDNTQHKENLLELKAIPELFNMNFFIPDYQRGYRWGKRQVEQLLDDLSNFFDKGKGQFYCLQPIVVKAMETKEIEKYKPLLPECNENCWYEVIDGQQRLTTIRILLSLFHRIKRRPIGKFTIFYKTRPDLGKVFDDFIYDIEHNQYHIDLNNSESLDIDSWHILQAAQTILKWLQVADDNSAGTGFDYFEGSFYESFVRQKNITGKKSVQVIWYELRDGSYPNDTFKKLNDKKVSLNNAELIRAMFLSDSAVYETDPMVLSNYKREVREAVKDREQARKQAHIVEQWDIIEKQLRQPQFWAFVKDDASDDAYRSRIEYLFDLISKKQMAEKDELYTYLRFEEMVRKNEVAGLWELWLKVESYFATLLSWFYNREKYHKIGYLIAEKGSHLLVDLLEKSAEQSKSQFDRNINWLIKQHMVLKKDDDIYAYSYDDDAQRAALKKILFFFNVESTRKAKAQDYFPFEQYKKLDWSLEHIHAQNSERVDRTDKKKWAEWIDKNIHALKRLAYRINPGDPNDPSDLIKSLQADLAKVENDDYVFDNFTTCFDSVVAYYNKMAASHGGTPEVHNISNMALLDGATNAQIGNHVFEVKRQCIIEKDAQGDYIPYCTRLVFLKYYNVNNEDFSVQQSFYWSEEDRESYLDSIKSMLQEVLGTEDLNVKSTDQTI